MKSFSLSIFLFILILMVFDPASAANVGSVKNSEGQAWIIRGEAQIPAKAGESLMVNDIMKTDTDGAMGIIMQDDTIISMGPNSRMVLVDFVFQPEEGRFSMLTRFLKGTFTYISGTIAKLNPESVKVETPVGMVAIRGTHFLLKIEDHFLLNVEK
ncbi:MAG: hypothetical protein VR65_22285 [Desulfobulbaceae bacterium BRH_c16a]|nr:MAG: hypothetical protein VR65_22285 [Desulfobulbaceae bacterium BRH_c16a]